MTAQTADLEEFEANLRTRCRKSFFRSASDWRGMAGMVEDAIKVNEADGNPDLLPRQRIQLAVYREMETRHRYSPETPEVEESKQHVGGENQGHTKQGPRKASQAFLNFLRKLITERGKTLADYKLTEDHLTEGHFRALSVRDAMETRDFIMETPAQEPRMTEPQRDLLIKLMIESGVNAETATKAWTAMQPQVTQDRASEMIDKAIAAAKKAPKTTGPEEGFYECGDMVIKVQRGTTTSNIYAKTLQVIEGVGVEWNYEGNAANFFRNELKGHEVKPLSKERALQVVEAISAELELYGACWMCGRKLTDEESIARRIGRICFEKCC